MGLESKMTRRFLTHSIITIVVGFCAVYLGLIYGTIPGAASPVWPATGIFVGLVYQFGYIQIVNVFLTYSLARYLFSFDLINTLGTAIPVSIEALLGVYMIRALQVDEISDQSLFGKRGFGHLLVGAVIGAVSSFLGVLILYATHFLPISKVFENGLVWFLGDFLGYIYFGPFIVSIGKSRQTLAEINKSNLKIGWFVAALLSSVLVFFTNYGAFYFVFIFASCLFFTNNCERFEYSISGLVVYIISLLAIALKGLPFNSGNLFYNLVNIQILLVAVGVFQMGLEELKTRDLLKRSKVVLLVSLTISCGIFVGFYELDTRQNQKHLADLVEQFENKIQKRMQAYIDGLRGGRSFILATGNVDSVSWEKFVDELDLVNRYPGINGMGLIKRVPADQLDSFLKLSKSKLPKLFQYKKVPGVISSHNDYSDIVVLVEPLAPNQRALGLDIASEDNRRESAQLSLQLQLPVITQRVILVQDNMRRPGFLLFLPIRNTENTLSQNLNLDEVSFVYAPFVTEKFLEVPVREAFDELRIKISDVDGSGKVIDDNVIFSNHQDFKDFTPLSLNRIIEMSNQKWFIEYKTTPSFRVTNHFFSSSSLLLGILLALAFAGVVGTTRQVADISERRAQELSEKIIYKSKFAALGEMANGISHELNNPLMILLGSSDQIRKIVKGSTSRELFSINVLLDRMDLTIQRMAKITRSLMDFSSESNVKDFRPVSLAEIVEGALQVSRQKFYRAGIALKEGEVPDVILDGHSLQLVQVMHNLLTNSFDAVENLEEKWVELEYFVSPKSIEIKVRDSGAGIAEDVAEKMMQPFFTTKPIGKGMGLGLSENKGIITAHHGNIYLDSTAKNTTFVVLLPCVRRAA